jgi:membrane-bound lytic murein transglycosylase D
MMMVMRATVIPILVFVLLGCSNTLHYTYPPPSEPMITVELGTTVQEKEPLSPPLPEPQLQDKPQKQDTDIPLRNAPVKQDHQYDIAFEITPQVESWINRLSGKEKKHFQISLTRLDRIRPVMEEIFERHGIPKDLVYLCLVESGANPYAVSCSGATGYWQFIPDTAKRYGLQVNRLVDERKHLDRSTEAAAHYLKDLYAVFGDWLLAIAAYNAGEGAISRLMKSNQGVYTFWDISHSMTIKTETLDYVPKFIATVVLTKNREKYGLPMAEPSSKKSQYAPNADDSPIYFDKMAQARDIIEESNTVLVTDNISPSSKGSRLKAAKTIDSGITYTVRKGDTLYFLAKKYATTVETIAHANGISPKKRLALGKVLTIPANNTKGLQKQKREQVHVVAKGDTLEGNTKKYGTTVGDIKHANRLKDPRGIQPKKVLAIPRSKNVQAASVKTTLYKVKKGDTLWGISRQFDVSQMDLRRWNRLTSAAQIKPGDNLTIYRR